VRDRPTPDLHVSGATNTKVSSTFYLVVAHAQAAAIVTKRSAMESELGAVVDALPGLVWTAFPDGQIDYLNQRWSDYTGLGVEESLGRGWQAAVHLEDLPRLLAGWQANSASRVPVETQVRLRGPDGKYRWFLFCAHPSADASGEVVKWCGLGINIDDRMQAAEAQRASERRFRLIVDGPPAAAPWGWTGAISCIGRIADTAQLRRPCCRHMASVQDTEGLRPLFAT
jgi:PAS domain S-box-containing protein